MKTTQDSTNLNIKSKDQQRYDAIVIGSGISGGWAAKELCEKGLKTLVLERGRMVRHVADYPTMNMDPWELPGRGGLTAAQADAQQVQRRTGFVHADNAHFFVSDKEHPYTEVRRFD